MSFSVDDLVNSFNSSHIGQEARDLAALQAQLAEALFGVSSPSPSTSAYYDNYSFPPSASSSYPGGTSARGMHIDIPTQRGRSQHTRPCNTPLVRTPSSSVGLSAWAQASEGRRGGAANANAGIDEMDEDEKMVEELLLSSSSTTSNSFSSSTSYPTSSSYQYQLSWPQQQENSDTSSSLSSTPSLFTTTDPFYLAQVQAAQAFSNNATRNYTTLAGGNGAFSSSFNFGSNGFTTGNNGGGDNNNNGMNMNGESQYHAFAHTQACGDLPAYQCATAF